MVDKRMLYIVVHKSVFISQHFFSNENPKKLTSSKRMNEFEINHYFDALWNNKKKTIHARTHKHSTKFALGKCDQIPNNLESKMHNSNERRTPLYEIKLTKWI